MATVTGKPAAAPYAASAPAAFPADGAARARAPRCLAIVTAAVIPRALNDPVGFRASSLTQTRSATAKSGVQPSDSDTSPSTTGSTSRYRQRDEPWSDAGFTAPGVSA